MAPIHHVFTSPHADVADPTLVRPSAWNSVHAYTLQDAVSLSGNTAGVLANISSGTLYLAGGNNVTLSQAGNSVTVSAAAGGAQSEQTQSRFNLTLSGNTAGALALISSGVMTLAGGNNITLSQAGNAVTVSAVATVAQTEQTQSRFNLTLGGNTAGALALISSGVLTLAGGNNVTLSQAGNAVTVSAAATIAQTEQTQSRFNLTLGGNTAGAMALVSSGVLTLAGGNNVTLSQAGNAVTISGPTTAAQTVQTQNMHNVTLSGNTAGVLAHISSGTWTLVGGDNITLSQNGNAVSIIGVAATGGGGPPIATTGQSVASANSVGTVTRYAAEDHRHAGLYQISVGGNTAGQTSAGAGSLHLAGGPNITLSGATAAGGMTLSVSAAAGGAGAMLSRWISPDKDVSSIGQFGQGSQTVGHMLLPNALTASKLCFYGSVNIANAANNSSAFLDMSILFGVYTRSSATLFSLATASTLFSTSWSSNATGSVAGVREFSCPINLSLLPDEYYLLLNLSTTNTGPGANTTVLANTITLYGGSNIASNAYAVPFGVSTTASRNQWSGMGIYSVVSAAIPDQISVSGILQTGTAMQRANVVWDFRLKD